MTHWRGIPIWEALDFLGTDMRADVMGYAARSTVPDPGEAAAHGLRVWQKKMDGKTKYRNGVVRRQLRDGGWTGE